MYRFITRVHNCSDLKAAASTGKPQAVFFPHKSKPIGTERPPKAAIERGSRFRKPDAQRLKPVKGAMRQANGKSGCGRCAGGSVRNNNPLHNRITKTIPLCGCAEGYFFEKGYPLFDKQRRYPLSFDRDFPL